VKEGRVRSNIKIKVPGDSRRPIKPPPAPRSRDREIDELALMIPHDKIVEYMKKGSLMGRRQDFIVRLVNMKHEAGTLGLFRTLHALDHATREVGYEMEDLLTGKQKT